MSADTPGGQGPKIVTGDGTPGSTSRARGHSRSFQRKAALDPVSVPVYSTEPLRSGKEADVLNQGTPRAQNGYPISGRSPRGRTPREPQTPTSAGARHHHDGFMSEATKSDQKMPLEVFPPVQGIVGRASPRFDWSEILSGALIPLPFICLPIVWRIGYLGSPAKYGPLESAKVAPGQEFPSTKSSEHPSLLTKAIFRPNFFTVCLITAGTLLCIGLYGALRSLGRNAKTQMRRSSQDVMSMGTVRRLLARILSVGLPLYAASKLSGQRVALIFVVSLAADLMSTKPKAETLMRSGGFLKTIQAHRLVLAAVMIQLLSDLTGMSEVDHGVWSSIVGYVAISTSVLALPPPYLTTRPKVSIVTSPVSKKTPRSKFLTSPLDPQYSSGGQMLDVQSPLISTPWDTDLTLASGILAGLLGVVVLLIAPEDSREVNPTAVLDGVLTTTLSTLCFLAASPRLLRSPGHLGALIGIVITLVSDFLSYTSTGQFLAQSVLAGLFWFAVEMDSRRSRGRAVSTSLASSRMRRPSLPREPHSKITGVLLGIFQDWPLVHSILVEKDSRRIFYFMSLNFAFMIVQTFYGYVSKSLGLLSDSVHMFFDCVALLVGLAAAVMSKWPPDLRFPYGYGMIDTLAGFANGVFLILISLEIIYEAVERLAEGVQIQRLTELLVVSTLGLLVNCIGMLAFGHAHHGHGHGHDHGHGHGHDHHHHDHHSPHGHHSHDDSHNHDHSAHGHTHSHNHDSHTDGHAHDPHGLSHSHSHSHGHSHSHHHSHGNENMIGIWLHILADTLGSAAVVVSTILVHLTGWPGFDPLASCLIAVLIFGSAVPLVTSTAKRLLLTVPDATEFDIREAITGVSELPGVVGVTIPRVWVGGAESGNVQGVMHVVVNRTTDMDDARKRTVEFLRQKDMDVLVQVEREGDIRCWCGAAMAARRD